MMSIAEECERSDDEDGDGGYTSGMDGDIKMIGATGGYVVGTGCERDRSNSRWLSIIIEGP
jgi:hypothetical protein